jgi:hypothetical protein
MWVDPMTNGAFGHRLQPKFTPNHAILEPEAVVLYKLDAAEFRSGKMASLDWIRPTAEAMRIECTTSTITQARP